MIINYSNSYQIIDNQNYLVYGGIISQPNVNIRGIVSYTKHNSNISFTKNKSNHLIKTI